MKIQKGLNEGKHSLTAFLFVLLSAFMTEYQNFSENNIKWVCEQIPSSRKLMAFIVKIFMCKLHSLQSNSSLLS